MYFTPSLLNVRPPNSLCFVVEVLSEYNINMDFRFPVEVHSGIEPENLLRTHTLPKPRRVVFTTESLVGASKGKSRIAMLRRS
jgi:hypothetical protein